jgi:polyhydroxyalkanoate synthesis regulator phasin
MNKAQWKSIRPTLATIKEAAQTIMDNLGDVGELRDEEQEKFDNMPEGLRNSERGQALEDIVTALNTIAEYSLSDLTDAIDELEGFQ